VKTHGNKWRSRCPICGETLQRSAETGVPFKQHWRIPFSPIETVTVAGGYFNMLPMLKSDAVVYGFSICPKCESIFINPFDDGQTATYTRAVYPVERITDPDKMAGHRAQYDKHLRGHLVGRAGIRVFDAGCGIGQYLFFAAEDPGVDGAEYIGFELSQPAVDAINEAADKRQLSLLWAKQYNLCLLGEDAEMQRKLGLFNFIIMSETFEHLDHPADVMKALAQMLAPGGRIFYTAQAPEGGMAVRPAEPIYMSRIGQELLIEQTGLKLISTVLEAGRWKTVLEK